MVFVDGVGLGPAGNQNPLAGLHLPGLLGMSGGVRWIAGVPEIRTENHVFLPVDANLGVDGLPQSGTGQASLFTGINCAQIAGRHFGPFPHSTSRPIIARDNVFMRLARDASISAGNCAFANAYPERFFSYVRSTDRWTVTTLCCLNAGVRLHSEADLIAGKAVAANITGEGWPGRPIPIIEEQAAAQRLLSLASERRFTLFEYYLTDKAGHGRPGAPPDVVLRSLDAFLGGLITDRPSDLTIILTSDHGNLEDVATRSHTRNPVPLIAIGPAAGYFKNAASILDVTPAIVQLFADEATLPGH